ncbi:MAG: hypothetical protein FWG44_06970 [Oscillospiraceae bacterium]|nr:hypothetical protein [Oscillospiraceae bacterium]
MNIKRERYPIKFGKSGAYLRFDISAARRLAEESEIELYDPESWKTTDWFKIFSAGLMDYFENYGFSTQPPRQATPATPPRRGMFIPRKNKEANHPVNQSIVKLIFAGMTDGEILEHLYNALILSLPPAKKEPIPKKSKIKIDFKYLRHIFCDVMNGSEAVFYESTIREIDERWDLFAIYKGIKEKPMFSDEVYEELVRLEGEERKKPLHKTER